MGQAVSDIEPLKDRLLTTMKIERITLDALTCDPANARKHDKRNLDAIKGSLQRFGQQHPIIVDAAGVIRAGNGRFMAMRALGWSECDIVRSDLKGSEATAFAIADNRTAELAAWDDDALAQQLAALQIEDELLALATGYDAKEIAALALDASELVEDEVPEPPADPITKPGDLWLLGDHRLLCGDSTKAEDVARVMDGETADLCMTDPPYGADIKYATHNDTQDALVGLIARFFPLAQKHARLLALTPGINNIWHYTRPDWVLCWFYGAGTGRSPWGFTAWQPILVWGKDPKLAHGEGCHPDGFQFMMSKSDATENRALDHACPKPLSVWCRFMERLSHKKSRLVYEPFCGSGTTLIAAEQLGRTCYGMEISPAYCDVIVKRWETLTGKQATRA